MHTNAIYSNQKQSVKNSLFIPKDPFPTTSAKFNLILDFIFGHILLESIVNFLFVEIYDMPLKSLHAISIIKF